ncbi:MAG: hypothetical protein ABJN84_12250 [Flavobacteriaceae bacterium]
MGEFFKAELKDRFLEYALERTDYFEIQSLYDEYLRPNYNLKFVEKLIKEIRDYDASLLDIMSGNGIEVFMMASTPSTRKFLNEGGFMSIFVREEEKWDTFSDQLSSARKLRGDEKSRHGKKRKKPYGREKTLLFALIFAVTASFLFTLFSVLKNVFFDADTVSKSDFEEKLYQIQLQNTHREELLQNEIEQLKSQIERKDSASSKND